MSSDKSDFLGIDTVVQLLCKLDGSLYAELAKKKLDPDIRLDAVVDLLEERGCIDGFIVIDDGKWPLDGLEIRLIDDRYVVRSIERGILSSAVDFRSRREAVMHFLLRNFRHREFWPKSGPYAELTRKVFRSPPIVPPEHLKFFPVRDVSLTPDTRKLLEYRERTEEESKAYWRTR